MRAPLAVVLLLLGLIAPCAAQERPRELRLGVGSDVLHQRGVIMGSLAMYPFSLLVWDENLNFGVGLSAAPTTTWARI